MAFKRYYPSRDTSIANYDKVLLTDRYPTNFSNVGASEILNLYKYGWTQTSMSMSITGSSSGTLIPVVDASGAYIFESVTASAKVLIDFDPITIPSASFSPAVFLKLFDAQHDQTLPAGYTVIVKPLEQDWTEGKGHDLDFYTDRGAANYVDATLSSTWASTTGTSSVSFSGFITGHEDLEVDLSGILMPSMGFEVYISSNVSDLYIKKFHSRQSHFPTKRPFIEVRWNDATGTLSTSSMFMATGSGPWSGTFVQPWRTSSFGGIMVDVTNSLKDPTGILNFSLYDLKPVYDNSEVVRLHLYAQPRTWSPTETLSASSGLSGSALTMAYYRVVDAVTDEVLVPFGSGSPAYTKLSYNDEGNYFDFYMSSMPTGTLMKFDFEYEISGTKTFVSGDEFKFRVR